MHRMNTHFLSVKEPGFFWRQSHVYYYYNYYTRLTALFPGLPGWAGTRKVKPIWILLKQETVSGSGIKSAPGSRQITTPAPHHSSFYRPDALPATQPTASKHWSTCNALCYRKYTTQQWHSNGLCRLCNAQGPGGNGAPLRGLQWNQFFCFAIQNVVKQLKCEIYGFLHVLTQQSCNCVCVNRGRMTKLFI